MSENTMQDRVTKTPLVYSMPGMTGVNIRRDVEYRPTDAGALTLDLYSPPDAARGSHTRRSSS